jgi:hypothetical protein
VCPLLLCLVCVCARVCAYMVGSCHLCCLRLTTLLWCWNPRPPGRSACPCVRVCGGGVVSAGICCTGPHPLGAYVRTPAGCFADTCVEAVWLYHRLWTWCVGVLGVCPLLCRGVPLRVLPCVLACTSWVELGGCNRAGRNHTG